MSHCITITIVYFVIETMVREETTWHVTLKIQYVKTIPLTSSNKTLNSPHGSSLFIAALSEKTCLFSSEGRLAPEPRNSASTPAA